MELQTKVDTGRADFQIAPCEGMLFVGSCFADSIGQRFVEEKFRATVNPFGVMYNPASILHTIERVVQSPTLLSFPSSKISTAFLTLGTNHIYRLKETGEIVDNCQKRPAELFQEEELTVDECADYLQQAVNQLLILNPEMNIVLTVSPIRYRKYGYHGSQLSKATLLLAIHHLVSHPSPLTTHHSPLTTHHSPVDVNVDVNVNPHLSYFPAYEIVMDELRDYRFYKADMLHPSEQAVDYIWERLVDWCFSPEAKEFLRKWAPLKAALNHRPFDADSEAYKTFMDKTMLKVAELQKKYPTFAL